MREFLPFSKICLAITESGLDKSPSVFHQYASAISAVAVGAGLAFLYTYILGRNRSSRELLTEFSSDLLEIQKLCEKYWLGDWHNRKEAAKLRKTGYALSAKMLSTTEYRELMKKLLKKRFSDFDELDVKLNLLATGGNFQTRKMVASPDTYQEIMFIISKTELILRELRRTR